MAECPICDAELIEDETFDQVSIDEKFSMTATFNKVGHCPNCDKEYQWDVCYDLENPLIIGLSEV